MTTTMTEHILSNRCSSKVSKARSSHGKHVDLVWKRLANDAFDPALNPKGLINLGTAENHLMADIVSERLSRDDINTHDPASQCYFPHKGYRSFRSALAKFLQENFAQNNQILSGEQVVATSGANVALESLSFAIADHGDSFMIPSPCYNGMDHYISARAGIESLSVPCANQEGGYTLTVDALKSVYDGGVARGCNIRAVLLVSPGNPSGHVYSEGELVDAMRFCQREGLHLIVDEVFALSVHDPHTTFTSILSLDILEPSKTHFVWSFSKDFGLAGFRAAVVYTGNDDIISYMDRISCSFNCVPPMIQHKLTLLISDTDWLTTQFFPIYRKRLRGAYVKCRDALTDMGVVVRDSLAALFVVADFSKFLDSPASEAELLTRLLDEGVYCLAGQSMGFKQSGLFRVVFTVPTQHLDTALSRIKTALDKTAST